MVELPEAGDELDSPALRVLVQLKMVLLFSQVGVNSKLLPLHTSAFKGELVSIGLGKMEI